jgi:hypothetical protein
MWKIGRLKQAQDKYDISGVQSELKSLETYGWLLDRFEFMQDTKLWLALNLNSPSLTSELSAYQDDKHRFWLILYDLQLGNIPEAETVLTKISESTRAELAHGLLELANGNPEDSKKRLTETTVDWKSLLRQEQLLRYLGLAHADLEMNDLSSAHSELTAAKILSPSNPAVLATEFELAMKEMQWAKALGLGRTIRTQTWRTKSPLFETQMGLAALHESNQEELEKSLLALKEVANGEAAINYLNGIHAIMNQQTQEGKNLLESALKGGLDGSLKKDALITLDQINARQNVDQRLKSLAKDS